jgi:hypothetical protein
MLSPLSTSYNHKKKITFSTKRKALGKPSAPIHRRGSNKWSEENISKSYKRLESKGKVFPLDTMKTYGEWRYSFIHIQPKHQTERSGHLHNLPAFPLHKKPLVPTEQEARWVSEPPLLLWTTDKPFSLPQIEPYLQLSRPQPSKYTDWAIPACDCAVLNYL